MRKRWFGIEIKLDGEGKKAKATKSNRTPPPLLDTDTKAPGRKISPA